MNFFCLFFLAMQLMKFFPLLNTFRTKRRVVAVVGRGCNVIPAESARCVCVLG